VSTWSAVWTNQTFSVGPDPNDPTLQVTNTIDVRFHALIVEHQFITRQTVETYKFAAKANHLVLRDDLTLQESFVADAPDVDLQSQINLQTNPISSATFPRVVNLTNGVALYTGTEVNLGSSARPIPNVVNQGFLYGSSVEVWANDLANSGTIGSFVGDVTVRGENLKVEGGSVASSANLLIVADDLKATASALSAGYQSLNQDTGNTNYFLGSLSLDVATRLTDGGVSASNVWTVYDGVRLARKPAQGDLLGTTLISKAPRFADVSHAWAGDDRGATAAGYENNAALGRLVLEGRLYSLYTFRSATGSPAALYVDSLEFADTVLDDPVGSLNVEPGFTLYFATSNVDPTLLDGLFEGRVRWVKDYAGPVSGTSVSLAGGQTIRVNRSVLASPVLDSDLDGIPNASDAQPLEAAALRLRVGVLASDPNQVEISWGGAPGARYRVEYSTRLRGAAWNLLTVCEAKASEPGLVKVCDGLSPNGEQRFYRVVEVR
ncbi:MAG: hypothetical protein JNL97_06000, partial [Verrucomicrobiales bacterium]|nr:hypothetical protein [Verrucomicrobiales bacterium]